MKAKAPGLTPASKRAGREVELCLELKGLEPGKGICPGAQLRTEPGGPSLWNRLGGHRRATEGWWAGPWGVWAQATQEGCLEGHMRP